MLKNEESQNERAKGVILKAGKEKAIINRHHWIFSGAIAHLPEFQKGDLLPVFTEKGRFLGSGYFNRQAKIIGRMVSFDTQDPLITLRYNMEKAIEWRQHFFDPSQTTAYRLINGEGDFLPGLIVDYYADYVVIQISTLGMERLRPLVLEILNEKLRPKAIYEKSHLPSRKEEGLHDFTTLHSGEMPEEILIKENGLYFFVSPQEGQKTGFFLDHREMRQQIRLLAKDRRVLNCFSYTGGFSVYAAAGGAKHVTSVDISEKASMLAQRNMQENGFSGTDFPCHTEDVFKFLREASLTEDLVILDPPAFAKRQKDVIQACRGYKDINRIAMQKMAARSLLLTSSCSYHVDEDLFQKVIFQASLEANRKVRIIGRHQLAQDHPINICHPETDYLKSLLLYIE